MTWWMLLIKNEDGGPAGGAFVSTDDVEEVLGDEARMVSALERALALGVITQEQLNRGGLCRPLGAGAYLPPDEARERFLTIPEVWDIMQACTCDDCRAKRPVQ